MKKIDCMTKEEMMDVIETLAWRVAAYKRPDAIIDDKMIEMVLREEGVTLGNE